MFECTEFSDVIKSPQETGGLIVSANFQLSGKTPEANFFKPHILDLWVCENFLAPILVTLGQGH